jgi:hypothetical protein
VPASSQPQDHTREDQLRALFGLEPGDGGRSGTDAKDDQGRTFELKSTTKDRVTTARDVSTRHLERWRGRTWIIGRGEYSGTTFHFQSTWVLTPAQLEPWFLKIENRLVESRRLGERVLAACGTNDFRDDERQRIAAILKRGSTLNNPHITLRFIETNGTRVTDHHAERLQEIVAAR